MAFSQPWPGHRLKDEDVDAQSSSGYGNDRKG